MNKGILYIVPTPIGNLEDMTLRAIRVLKEADLILAEDTRTSGVLLKHYEISTPMRSHHKYNEHETVKGIVEKINSGETVALISDAGTPGISDPGFLLARECRRAGAEVICLPGATAFVPALVASGLPSDRFVFEGFLPPKKGRKTRLTELADETRTVIIYESPKKLIRTLRDLGEFMGPDRAAAVCREISKIHETINVSTLGELLNQYSENQAKGEIVIVVKGKGKTGKEVYSEEE